MPRLSPAQRRFIDRAFRKGTVIPESYERRTAEWALELGYLRSTGDGYALTDLGKRVWNETFSPVKHRDLAERWAAGRAKRWGSRRST